MALSSDDLTPTLAGTLNSNLSSGDTLRIYSGASFLGNASIEGRNWIFTPDSDLATNRSHSFSARVADAAGNLGTPSNTRRLILDSAAPATRSVITSISDNVGLIQGNLDDGASSDDLTPTLAGTLNSNLSSGETLGIYSGASFLGNASVIGNASFKSRRMNRRRRGSRGGASPLSSTGWIFTPNSDLDTNRTHSFSARVTDAAGNLGTPSNTRQLILDSAAPATRSVITTHLRQRRAHQRKPRRWRQLR